MTAIEPDHEYEVIDNIRPPPPVAVLEGTYEIPANISSELPSSQPVPKTLPTPAAGSEVKEDNPNAYCNITIVSQ